MNGKVDAAQQANTVPAQMCDVFLGPSTTVTSQHNQAKWHEACLACCKFDRYEPVNVSNEVLDASAFEAYQQNFGKKMKLSEPLIIDAKNYEEHLLAYFKNKPNKSLHNACMQKDEPAGWKTLNKIWVTHDFDYINCLEALPKSSILIVVLNPKTSNEIVINLIKKYIKIKKLILIVNGTPEKQAECMAELLDINLYEGWQPLLNSENLKENGRYYRVFYRTLAAKINIKSLYRATQIKTTHMFLRNSLINAPLAYCHVPVESFRDLQKNKPILIVAAGPSLNKQLPTLFKFQHVFTILAVDTVWPILKKSGITPDVLFALDSRSKTSWPEDGIDEQTCFAVDVGCAPRLVWSNKKNHFFSTTSDHVMSLLGRLGSFADIIPTGGSVATSAFGLARHMGGNPIVLIGQDLALTDGKDHADGYLHVYSDDFLKERTDTGFDIEGYYGQQVKTERQLLFYKNWYEGQIKLYPEIMVINSTEGGAKIHGCLQIPFEQVCRELEAFQPSKSFDFIKHDLKFNPEHLSLLMGNMDSLIEKTKKFIDLAHEGEALIVDQSKISLSKKLLKIDELNLRLLDFDEDARHVVDAYSQVKMHQVSYEIAMNNESKRLSIAVDKYLKIYVGIQESGYLALSMLEQVRKFYSDLSEKGFYDASLLDDLIYDAVLN